jgi:hypothetical protein
MFTKDDHNFLDMLFGKFTKHIDTDMMDLHDNDDTAGMDELEFRAAELEMTVDEMLHADL